MRKPDECKLKELDGRHPALLTPLERIRFLQGLLLGEGRVGRAKGGGRVTTRVEGRNGLDHLAEAFKRSLTGPGQRVIETVEVTLLLQQPRACVTFCAFSHHTSAGRAEASATGPFRGSHALPCTVQQPSPWHPRDDAQSGASQRSTVRALSGAPGACDTGAGHLYARHHILTGCRAGAAARPRGIDVIRKLPDAAAPAPDGRAVACRTHAIISYLILQRIASGAPPAESARNARQGRWGRDRE
eukprot:scaffold14_cov380-Prasinococcus_capsulatus_cf.AAC.5